MEKSYESGIATHFGSKSCGAARKGDRCAATLRHFIYACCPIAAQRGQDEDCWWSARARSLLCKMDSMTGGSCAPTSAFGSHPISCLSFHAFFINSFIAPFQ